MNSIVMVISICLLFNAAIKNVVRPNRNWEIQYGLFETGNTGFEVLVLGLTVFLMG